MELIDCTIGIFLKDQTRRYGMNVGLNFMEHTYLWREIDEISDQVALYFINKAYTRGDLVSIWSINCEEYIFCFLGLIKAGLVPVLYNSHYRFEEIEDLLQDHPVAALLYGDLPGELQAGHLLSEIDNECLSSNKALSIKKVVEEARNTIKIERLITEGKRQLAERMNELKADDTAVILFTSGTTSKPKGVMLSHRSILNNGTEIARKMSWTEKDNLCVAVPLFHCFGITACLMASLYAGCTMTLLSQARTSKILDAVEKKKCTVLNGVPSMFLALYHRKEEEREALKSIRSGVVAGSAISEKEYELITGIVPNARLHPSYGQTESSPCITIARVEDSILKKSQTCGQKIDHVELRIYDGRLKKEMKPYEVGEVQTRGYHVMKGYHNMPLETEKTILKDGWLRTGDLGYVDQEGYLYITGRMKEMIIRGGENISPKEIEGVLMEYGGIRDCKVLGVASEVLQEDIAACVVEEREGTLCLEDLRVYLSKRLAQYKVPKFLFLMKALPYNGSGKVMMCHLKKQVEERVGSLPECEGHMKRITL